MQQHSSGTHMDYVHEMARTLRFDEGLPLTLFIEKGKLSAAEKKWCVAQRFHFAPLRILENFFMLLSLRARGHKIFYVHYSFLSAISAGIVTKIFGGTVYYWNCGQPWMYKRALFQGLYEKFAYKCIDYLVTGVEAVAAGYMKTYGLTRDQIMIIPNWIDLDQVNRDTRAREKVREQFGVSGDTKILLFVHTLSRRYGAHLLPQILKELHTTDVHMLIAGDGNLRDSITEEFAALGLSKKMHMLGYASREVVEELLQSADVFVMPSEGAGSPHSLIEAMAYDLPFVSYDVGGVRETAPPYAAPYLFTYPETDSIAQGIRELLLDAEKYSAFQASERAWVRHFSKPAIASRFKSLLMNC